MKGVKEMKSSYECTPKELTEILPRILDFVRDNIERPDGSMNGEAENLRYIVEKYTQGLKDKDFEICFEYPYPAK